MTGLIFDIQGYAVHDGPGIRTLVFLKGCPMRCIWCCNPESQVRRPELRHVRARCKGCLSCVRACPRGAVTGPPPAFERSRCAACLDWPCVAACPEGALQVVGREMSPAEVFRRVASDLPFYRHSGGGVTFSGGEPLAQPAFLGECLRLCREGGVHTAVSTAGHADQEVVEAIEPLVDLFLFDLKVLDPVRHRELTGVPVDLVLANLRLLAARCPDKVQVRVPVVPGCTDSDANLLAISELVRGLGLRPETHAPYHALGSSKYGDLGRIDLMESARRPPVRCS